MHDRLTENLVEFNDSIFIIYLLKGNTRKCILQTFRFNFPFIFINRICNQKLKYRIFKNVPLFVYVPINFTLSHQDSTDSKSTNEYKIIICFYNFISVAFNLKVLTNMITIQVKRIINNRLKFKKKNRDVGEYTEWLNSLYDATEPLAIAQDDAEEYTMKLNDMRNVIEDTMETLFNYDKLYNNINQTYVQARNSCDEIYILQKEVNESITTGEKLTDETRGFIVDIQNNVQVRIFKLSSKMEKLI